MAWTKEQTDAIEKTGTNIIVSAGAGSGKTAVLSTRVIEKLKHGIHINELLILTFTNAAAAEMKERIKKKIKEENLNEELDLLDSAYITTFDSFSLSIVKKYHYLLNIPKEINITDSTIINIKKREILNEILEDYYKEEQENFKELIHTFCTKDDESLIEEILTLANILEIKTDLNNYLNSYIKDNYNEEKESTLINNYHQMLKNKLEEVMLEIKENDVYFESDYIQKLNDCITPLLCEEELNNLIAKIKITKLPALPKGSEEETKEAKEKINNILKDLKNMCIYGYIEEILEDYEKSKTYIEIIIDILKKYFQKLETYKLQNYIFDFSDIAKLSLKIIKENPSICNDLKNSFKEIMVDEYQDTSDIQEEFIQLIQNNNVYMVGDIKQSIYRFRNANPNIFKEKYDLYSKNENGIKIDLLKNFRSREEVLDNINIIFNKIMDDKIGNAEYEATHQMIFGNLKYKEIDTQQNYNMDILEYTPTKNISKEEIEIFTIAKDIQNKINNNYIIYDKESGETHNATYSDFVIIMDRNTTFDLTKKIFEYMGIPLSLYKDEDLNSSNDIYIIKNLLKFILLIKKKEFKKEFRYCYTSIARSFLYAKKDEEIYERITNNTIYESDIFNNLKEISQEINHLNMEEILLKVIEITNYYEKLITVGNIKEAFIRIEKIIALAKNTNSLNYTLEDFITYLEQLLEKNELIKFNVGASSSNSVKIMNIHKSKGLEYPICYYCGLYKSFSKEDIRGDIIYESSLPIYMPIFKEGIKETFLKLIIKEKRNQDDISEKIRLFYVALTRAKEKMILLLPKKENQKERTNANNIVLDTVRYKYKSLADMLYSIYDSLDYYKKEINIDDLNITKDYLISNIQNINKKEIKELEVINLSLEKKEKEKLTYSKKMNEIIDLETKRNIELGNYLHQILEYIDFKNYNPEEIEDSFIKNIISELVNSSLLKEIKNANIYQEYEFITTNKNEEHHGKIDLLLEYPTHIDIIDYKLNNIIDENYQKQLQGYKEYIESISNKKVNTYLFSLLSKEIKEV